MGSADLDRLDVVVEHCGWFRGQGCDGTSEVARVAPVSLAGSAGCRVGLVVISQVRAASTVWRSLQRADRPRDACAWASTRYL